MKKLGDKARRVWRTSPPRERAKKPGHQQYAQEDHQYISRPEPGAGLSPTLALVGAGPPASLSGTPWEVARTVRDAEEGQASQPYISTPLPEQVISSPPAAIEAGVLPKLSLGLLSGTET